MATITARSPAPLPKSVLDHVTRRAAERCSAPVACVSLVDANRRLLTGSYGLSAPIALLLAWACSSRVVASRRPLMVEDARHHPLMAHSPAVREGMMMAYAGAPLLSADGRAVGVLFVMDPTPRHWTDAELETLVVLAASAVRKLKPSARAAPPRRQSSRQ